MDTTYNFKHIHNYFLASIYYCRCNFEVFVFIFVVFAVINYGCTMTPKGMKDLLETFITNI